jgi:hypothetical protein
MEDLASIVEAHFDKTIATKVNGPYFLAKCRVPLMAPGFASFSFDVTHCRIDRDAYRHTLQQRQARHRAEDTPCREGPREEEDLGQRDCAVTDRDGSILRREEQGFAQRVEGFQSL